MAEFGHRGLYEVPPATLPIIQDHDERTPHLAQDRSLSGEDINRVGAVLDHFAKERSKWSVV
jgi:hypothetical protein